MRSTCMNSTAEPSSARVLSSFHRFPLGLGPSNRRLTRAESFSTTVELAAFQELDDDAVSIVQQLAGHGCAVPRADEIEEAFSRLRCAKDGLGTIRCGGFWLEHAFVIPRECPSSLALVRAQ